MDFINIFWLFGNFKTRRNFVQNYDSFFKFFCTFKACFLNSMHLCRVCLFYFLTPQTLNRGTSHFEVSTFSSRACAPSLIPCWLISRFNLRTHFKRKTLYNDFKIFFVTFGLTKLRTQCVTYGLWSRDSQD